MLQSPRLSLSDRLIQRFAIHGDISLLIYIYPASGTCDHSLYQYLVIVVKGDHISLGEIGSFYGNYDLSLLVVGYMELP